MATKYRYLIPDASLTHEGVPARDLTDEDVAALTEEQRQLVDGSPLYEAVVTKTAAKATAAQAEEEASS